MATFKEQQDDDAPLEVSLNTLKQQVNKRTEIEKSHQKRYVNHFKIMMI